jgi:hypothetical protein
MTGQGHFCHFSYLLFSIFYEKYLYTILVVKHFTLASFGDKKLAIRVQLPVAI